MQNTQSPPDPIPPVRLRRRFTVEQKQALLDVATLPGNSNSSVAREYDIAPSEMFQWKKAMSDESKEELKANARVGEASPNNEYYVAVAVLRADLSGSQDDALFQESFCLIQARDEEAARDKATVLFNGMTHSYQNEQGEVVSWSLREIVDVALIGDSSLKHGTELYSRHFRDIRAYRKFETALGEGIDPAGP